MIRAVVDANVFISGTIAPLGASAQTLQAWRGDCFELVTCPAVIAEVAQKLRLPRIKKKYPISHEDIANLLLRLSQAAYLVPGVASVEPGPPDPKDGMLFSAAIESDADFIVTGDKPLLGFSWTGRSRTVSPRQFRQDELPRAFVQNLRCPIFALEDITSKGVLAVEVEGGPTCAALFTTEEAAEGFRRERNFLGDLLTFRDPADLVSCLRNLSHQEKVAFNPTAQFCLTERMELVIKTLDTTNK